jgi:glycosyltransferase involved in cell wall biosynthesis
MIVKDESPVIARCLASLKQFIDYWVIVDTGSTDGTQDIIKEFLKDIPGELHERPWINFEHNRNEALTLAKGKSDFIMLIDADERLVYEPGFTLPPLSCDVYFCTLHQNFADARRALLINMKRQWLYKGVMHEELITPDGRTQDFLVGIMNYADVEDGHRAKDPDKFLKDARMLEQALVGEPENTRYIYYLAQSYLNAEKYDKALEIYAKRGKMLGWDQEVFWAKYMTGILSERLSGSPDYIIHAYCDAFQYRPIRSEPLYRLANFFGRDHDYILEYVLAKHGLTIPLPNDLIPAQRLIYDYGMLLECANGAHNLGKFSEAISYYEAALKKEIPAEIKKQIQANMVKAYMSQR